MSDQLGFNIPMEEAVKDPPPPKARRASPKSSVWEELDEAAGEVNAIDVVDRLDAQDLLFVTEPPPLILRTMAQTLDVESSGLRAVGSFSGCGGSALGLKSAGIEVMYAIEFVKEAAETYRANMPGVMVDQRDIRAIQPDEILEWFGMKRGELDLFEGSPPCSSFTTAGKRGKLWGQEKKYSTAVDKQRTDDLFWEWARLLDGLHPRAFMAENVPGMLMGDALDQYAQQISGLLSTLGYRVQARVLNAASYGVPQLRRRLIFVGLRNDQPGEWDWPAPTTDPPHTLRQALDAIDPDDPDHLTTEMMLTGQNLMRYRHLQEVRGRERYRGQVGMYGRWTHASVVRCVRCGKLLSDRHEITRATGSGKQVIPKEALCADGQEAIFPKNGFQFIVPDPDEPSPTIIGHGWSQSGASTCHPSEPRKLSLAEVRTICSFPTDFKTSGRLELRYERYGRAVPPRLYQALGQRLVEVLS